ncbi:CinA family protein [Aestuariibius insulae]|uniref:CinA family protein n=1 Tax=Aestuariibius insulae TaxID=2058287 RepID=UPI00345E8E09
MKEIEALRAEVVQLAKEKNVCVTTAESCTGGLLSGAITAVPGSSAVFRTGFVTYSNAAKSDLLGVKAELIKQMGAVSEEVAEAMAVRARYLTEADIAISTTGIAGPGGSEHKPEGRVCFGIAAPAGTGTETVEFGAVGRAEVRLRSVEHALTRLREVLQAI